MNTLQHDGFLAEIDIDEEHGILRGIVVNAQKPFEFEGKTVPELGAAFAKAVIDFQHQSKGSGFDGAPARPRDSKQHARIVKNASIRDRDRPSGALDYWPLQEAYDELLAGLYLAHRMFVSAGDNGIEGAKLACKQMARFINCRWENPELASPFMVLYKAFEDVQAGRMPDLFLKVRGATQRPRTLLQKNLTTFVAALHEVDIRLKTGAKESATRIARAVNRWPNFRDVSIKPTTIKNWRDHERASSAAERLVFDSIVKHLLAESDPKAKLELFLKQGQPGVPYPS